MLFGRRKILLSISTLADQVLARPKLLDGRGSPRACCPRIFLDDQHDPGPSLITASQPFLRAPHELGHIAEDQLLSITLRQRALSKSFRASVLDRICGQEDAGRHLDKTAGTICAPPA